MAFLLRFSWLIAPIFSSFLLPDFYSWDSIEKLQPTVLPGLAGSLWFFYRVVLGCTGLSWVLPGFTELWWSAIELERPRCAGEWISTGRSSRWTARCAISASRSSPTPRKWSDRYPESGIFLFFIFFSSPSFTRFGRLFLVFLCALCCIPYNFFQDLPRFTGLNRVLLSYTEFYLVLLGFTELFRVIPEFYRVVPNSSKFCQVLPRFRAFYRVLLSYTELYLVLLGFTELFRVIPEFHRVVPNPFKFYQVLLRLRAFYRALPYSSKFSLVLRFTSSTLFYWVLPGFTGFYRVYMERERVVRHQFRFSLWGVRVKFRARCFRCAGAAGRTPGKVLTDFLLLRPPMTVITRWPRR